MPLPRLWDDSLEKLRRRCHIDATEVRVVRTLKVQVIACKL